MKIILLILVSFNCLGQVATIKLMNGTVINNAPSGRDWTKYNVIGFDLGYTDYQIIIDENNPVTINGITILSSGYQNDPPDAVHPPGDIFDNNLETKWAAKGFGQWIQFTLPEIRTLESIDVAFWVGDRNDIFDLLISVDSINWTIMLAKEVGNLGNTLDNYDFVDVEAKHIKYVAQGNNQNNSEWNSISEIRFQYAELPCDCPEIEHDTIYIERIDTIFLQPKIFIKADSIYFELK